VPDAVAPVRSTDCDAYADFAADLEDPTLGYVQLEYPELTVELIDRSAGNITRWEWDFDGDGVTDLDYSRPPTAPLRWGYPIVNATYDVTLRVTDGQGCTDTLTRESYIRVSGCPE
jgi:PKD repeat protein